MKQQQLCEWKRRCEVRGEKQTFTFEMEVDDQISIHRPVVGGLRIEFQSKWTDFRETQPMVVSQRSFVQWVTQQSPAFDIGANVSPSQSTATRERNLTTAPYGPIISRC